MFRQMGLPEDVIKFLLKKNEFPYEWLDDFGKLILESTQMPLKEPVNFAWLRTPYVWQYL